MAIGMYVSPLIRYNNAWRHRLALLIKETQRVLYLANRTHNQQAKCGHIRQGCLVYQITDWAQLLLVTLAGFFLFFLQRNKGNQSIPFPWSGIAVRRSEEKRQETESYLNKLIQVTITSIYCMWVWRKRMYWLPWLGAINSTAAS